MDRALVSGTKGRGFNSRIAHHFLPRSKGISSMKKWIGPLVSLILAFLFGMGLVFGSFANLKTASQGKSKTDRYSLIPTQDEKEGEDAAPRMLRILREVQRQLDEWLRKLNDRIDREDATRFEVRFLDMIRNFLEWAKEKVDARIEAYEKQGPTQKGKKEIIRETYREILRFSAAG